MHMYMRVHVCVYMCMCICHGRCMYVCMSVYMYAYTFIYLTPVCVCVGGLEVGFPPACSWLVLGASVGGYVWQG